MCNASIASTKIARKQPAPDPDHNVPEDQRYSALICPRPSCRQASCTFAPAVHLVACQRCRWSQSLTPEHVTELLDALDGVAVLNTAAYLVVLFSGEDGDAPSSPRAYPMLPPSWHVLNTFPSLVLREVAA